MLVADSPLDLQTALNAAHRWECRFRFRFGVGPTKSAMMVFGPRRRLADCDLHLGGVSRSDVVKQVPGCSPYSHTFQARAAPDQPMQPPLCSVWLGTAEHVHVLPVSRGGQNFAPTHQQLCTSWMVQSADGVVWAGLSARLVLVCFAKLDGLTLNTWRWDDSSLFWDAPFPWPRVSDAHSPPLSSVWRLNRQGRGPTMRLPSLAAGIHPQSLPHHVRRWVQASISSLHDTSSDGATFSVNTGLMSSFGACAVLEHCPMGS